MKNVEIYYLLPSMLTVNLLIDGLRQLWLVVMETINVLYVSFLCIDFLKGANIVKTSIGILLADVLGYTQKVLLIRDVAFFNAHFLFLAIIITISIFSVLFFIWRIHQLRKKTSEIITEQEFLVNDLEKTILQLEESKEESFQHQLFMRRLTMVLTHDLQSPFRFLITSTEALHDCILNKDYEDSEALSKELKQSGEKTLRFLMDFTIWMKSISNGYKLKLETVKLVDLFTEIEQFFSEQMKSKRNILGYHVQGEIDIITDKELLKIVLRNIVDNANKHCIGGMIRMEAKKEQGFCNITVTDNGKGMSHAVLDKIKEITTGNQPYNICPESDERQGYKFISHFSQLLKMDLQVSSQPSIGTSIRLTGLSIVQ